MGAKAEKKRHDRIGEGREEIARLRERAALLESLLYEALTLKYVDETQCSPSHSARSSGSFTGRAG